MEFKKEKIDRYYEIGEEIGSGQFAIVRRCIHKETGEEYAAKFIKKKRNLGSRRGVAMEDIQREVTILQELDHENIVKLYEVYESRHEVTLLMELVSGGELFEFLSEREKVSEEDAVDFLKQILEGVKHMHERGIVHLDLKPENVMLLNHNSNRIKLIDFGLSRKLKPGKEFREMLGTPEFVAPEVLNYDPLCLETDMWSIGVITYILLSGCSPFLGDDQLETFTNVSSLSYSLENKHFRHTSHLAKDFINSLLIKHPKDRLTVDECLDHSWIKPEEEIQKSDRKSSLIDVENLKSFVARARWQRSVRIVTLCNKLTKASKCSDPNVTMNGNGNNMEEDEEDNFVTTALFCASEEGNLTGLEDLLESVANLNLNQANKHGETALHMAASGGHVEIVQFLHSKGIDLTLKDKHGDGAVYWAARQGHVGVIQYLHNQGVNVDTQNKAGEAAIHVAARYGHTQVIEYLCSANCDVNMQDKLGDTGLHSASWHGLPRVCALLCNAGCKLDLINKEEESALHCASVRGNLECVRVLVDAGADLDLRDKKGNTALHLACKRHYSNIALMLLHAGCSMDAYDHNGETALHFACREGLLTIVQTLCAFGCNVDVKSKAGLTPLHLASRAGHTEIVRCLMLSGANAEIPNKEGVTCEIMALAQGHREIADLLIRLKPEKKEIYMKQLMPTSQPLSRIKVKVFGHSGVGKTTLLESLKCGYLGSFFRRKASGSGPIHRQTSLENCSEQQPNPPLQMTYELAHENYTQGIDIQQCNMAGVGDVSIWEFSGYEPYYMMYDHFIGDVNCMHAIVFSLVEPLEDQLAQVKFWLSFIKARIAIQEPVAHGGRQPFPASVVLIATHADKANCTRDPSGEYVSTDALAIYGTVREMFKEDFDIHEHLFVVDSHAATSAEVKGLKTYLNECKTQIIKRLPTSKGFLDAVINSMPNFRKSSMGFPVLTWPSFAEYIRTKVNTLASEDHLRELMHQLQLVGEVIYLEMEKDHDLVVMNPKWLCSDVFGHLLSHDQLMRSRPTGCYTAEDIQLMFPETEAENILKILESLELCTQCDLDGDIEYEFTALNFIDSLHGLWEKDPKRADDLMYGGVQYQTPRGVQNQLVHIFPRIQVQMRRVINGDNNNPENDLYQWYHGSKFCSGYLESLVTLEENDQVIEIKARGPSELSSALYHFFDDICQIIEQVITQCCPGIVLEKQLLSITDLVNHTENVKKYPSHELLKSALVNTTKVKYDDDNEETFEDLMCFGCEEIYSSITFGVDLHISNLPHHARRQLSLLLDPPDKMGRDWCLLAVSLGLSENVPALDNTKNFPVSKTDQALAAWSSDPQAVVANLISRLEELGRQDAVDAVLMTIPLFKILSEESSQDVQGATPASQSSQSTISR